MKTLEDAVAHLVRTGVNEHTINGVVIDGEVYEIPTINQIAATLADAYEPGSPPNRHDERAAIAILNLLGATP